MAVAAVAAAVASAAKSPAAELAAMRNAVASEHSLRYVTVSTAPGLKTRTVADVGQTRGIQRFTITRQGRTGPATVIVWRKAAFLKGTAFTMRVFFGFTPTQSKRYAGQWIFIPHSSPAFGPIADGATFGSFTPAIFPQTGLSLVTAAHLIGVHGTAQHEGMTTKETLFAPNRGKPLPAREIATSPGSPGKDVSTMSRWNETVHVTVPANAVPISVVNDG